MKVFLYGSGQRCEILVRLLKKTDITILGIIDSNELRWGNKVGDIIISPPAILQDDQESYVCVTFFGEHDCESIWTDIRDMYGFSEKKIISLHYLLQVIFQKIIGVPNIDINSTNKQKIIIDGTWKFGLGGVEEWIKDTYDVLAQERDDVFLFTNKEETSFEKKLNEHVMDIWFEKNCSFAIETVSRAINVLIKNLPCSVVCSRADEILLASAMIKQRYTSMIKIIVVVHGACDGIVKDVGSYRQFVDKYLCVSRASMNAMLSNKIEQEKCRIINSPVKYEALEKKQYETDISKPVRIGYAGRLEVFHKRADLLPLLIKKLEELNVNYVFEIAGKGTYLPEIQKFIKENNLQKKIKCMGLLKRDDMMSFWKSKDISVNVSNSEGRPISNIEAMLCGVVPVATATSGIMEDVIDGINGYLVQIGDCLEMARKIKYLSDNRYVMQKIGLEAQRMIGHKTNVKEYVSWWNVLLGELQMGE